MPEGLATGKQIICAPLKCQNPYSRTCGPRYSFPCIPDTISTVRLQGCDCYCFYLYQQQQNLHVFELHLSLIGLKLETSWMMTFSFFCYHQLRQLSQSLMRSYGLVWLSHRSSEESSKRKQVFIIINNHIFCYYMISCLYIYNPTSMFDKSIQQKIRDCRELVIQNMEKTIQHKYVYLHLKDRKMQGEVKQFIVNGKDGIIKIEFFQHERALAFYNDSNFKDKIFLRPFNIYFNLSLSKAEMKKYYLEGITQQNQRSLFQIARKIGICKIYNRYSPGSRGKLKPTGLLSFIRKEDIGQEDFKFLAEQLKALGIKISAYIQGKNREQQYKSEPQEFVQTKDKETQKVKKPRYIQKKYAKTQNLQQGEKIQTLK